MTLSSRRGVSLAVLGALTPWTAGHAVLTQPTPRPNQVNTIGTKLQPFDKARDVANLGCGGNLNLDPGVQIPEDAYGPGDVVEVRWKLTVAHPADIVNTGVRIALHYGPLDSFSQNILGGGLIGDPGFVDNTGDGIIDNALPAGETTSLDNDIFSTIVTLPQTKTCNYCTLQFVWAAQADGGYYVGCSDISITNNRLLPNFNDPTIPPEAGNELPQNNLNPGSGPGGGIGGGGDGGSSIWVPLLIVFLLVGAAAGYYYYKKNNAGDGGSYGSSYGGGGGGKALPPGWTASVDPTTGRTYYLNTMTNESSWEPPTAPAPPAGGPAMPQVADLPPGWSEAKDDTTGRVYYINNVTGASSWEKPTNRF